MGIDNKNRITFIFLVSFIVVFIDQISKFLIRQNFELNESIPIIKNVFHLTYVANKGSAFGILNNIKYINVFFILISFIVIGFLIGYMKKGKNLPKMELFLIVLLLGGVVGNLTDRLIFGHVIDFIDFRVWPVFNIADSAITVSIILLVFYFLTKTNKKFPP